MTYNKDQIIESISEEFEIKKYDVPSAFKIFVFYMVDSGMFLYNDTVISHETFKAISQELKYEGEYMHQGELSARYRLKIFKYPARYYRQVSNKLREKILERDNRRCVYCSSTHRLQIDHIVPWTFGGLTHEDNLQVLCSVCNLKKTNK